MSDFQIFVQNLVCVFEKQRKWGYEFAVLFLTSQEDIDTKPDVTFYVGDMTTDNQVLTDKSDPTFPPDLTYATTSQPGLIGEAGSPSMLRHN